jgi:ABC-type Fe3+/spermidine/putrescine transport system ATPase subunit
MSSSDTVTTVPVGAAAIPVEGHRVAVRSVRKRFGHTQALGGVDLDIEPGTFMVLLGPSGSGKTTLLRGLAGIERFDSGSVALGDRVVSEGRRHVPAEERRLAMVFQDYALWPHMTVERNVAYALRRHRLDARLVRSRVAEMLDRLGLGEKSANYPQELSGGQQQRVALARAIVGDPALLLFDEPLSNLDADLREHLRVEISTLTRAAGATAVYITHDQSEAFALADVVGVLREGVLEQLGRPEEIYQNPASPFVARFTGLAGSFTGVSAGTVGDRLRVRVGEHELFARTADVIPGGVSVEVMIRPSAPALHADPSDEAAGSRSSGAAAVIPGRIADVAYRGRGYDHVVVTEYGSLTSVFDARGWARGTACRVAIDPEGCLAFRRDSSQS